MQRFKQISFKKDTLPCFLCVFQTLIFAPQTYFKISATVIQLGKQPGAIAAGVLKRRKQYGYLGFLHVGFHYKSALLASIFNWMFNAEDNL